MTNELLELFPIQFIEGINENEEPTSGRFLIWGNYGIAIPYTPSMTYNLTGIEMYGSPEEKLLEREEHVVRLYTDHDDNPSRNCLAQGKLATPSDIGEQWLSIKLEKPVVIFANCKYWLSILEYPLMFAIGHSENGKGLRPRGNPHGHWVSSTSDREWRFMLKFFGRVLSNRR